MISRLSIGVLLAFVTFVAAGQASPQLRFADGAVSVIGLELPKTAKIQDSRWPEILSVFTHEAFAGGINQAIAGKYALTSEGISFEPAYAFAEGMTYHAVFSSEALSKILQLTTEFPPARDLELAFQIPGQKHSKASIESVYPESEVVPENLLRIYIAFSGPMMPGEAYNHIKLINEKGQPVKKAFLIVDQEMWDPCRTQLTILFDPGRIKRGLKANLDLGTPLREGEKYELLIDSAWRDVNGNFLRNNFSKAWVVTKAQRTRLTIDDLKINPPMEDSREPLVVVFNRLIDHNLVAKFISVENQSHTIEGKFELINDKELRFTPTLPWHSGSYHLAISPLLEDVSGNNFKNAFDLDLSKDTRVISNDIVKREFSIRPRQSN